MRIFFITINGDLSEREGLREDWETATDPEAAGWLFFSFSKQIKAVIIEGLALDLGDPQILIGLIQSNHKRFDKNCRKMKQDSLVSN